MIIGFGAFDMYTTAPPGSTRINMINPATEADTITKVRTHFDSAATAVKVGSFIKTNGNTFTCRDYTTIGAVDSGIQEHDVSFEVEVGDYIGIYYETGSIDSAPMVGSTGVGGVMSYSASGDQFDAGEQSYSASSNVHAVLGMTHVLTFLSYQIAQTGDDGRCYWNGSSWVFQYNQDVIIGYNSSSFIKGGGYFRFQNVAIPQGAIVEWAILDIKSPANTYGNPVYARIRGADEANVAAPTDETEYWAIARTTEQVDWDDIADWGATWHPCPPFGAVANEIINRGDWVSGNALLIFVDDHDDRSTHSSGCGRTCDSWSSSPNYGTRLYIAYRKSWSGPNIAEVDGMEAATIAQVNRIDWEDISQINDVG